MEFFKNAGNWFRGAFGGESEEEKKRKRQQQQKPKPQQTLPKQKPTTMNDLFGKKQNPATQAPSFTQPKPIKPETKPQPKAVVPLSVPETQRQAGIPQKFNFDEKEAKTISDGFKKGTVSKQQYVDYTKKAAENAKKKMTNGKVTFQNVVDSTVATGVSMAQDIPRAAMTLANTKAGVKEYKPKGTIDRFFFGDEPVKDAEGYGKDLVNSADSLRTGKESDIAKNVPPALLITLGVVLAASDLIPGGKAKKNAAEEAIKLTEKQLGRKLTAEEIDQARDAAAKTVDTPDARVQRENQRKADEAIARNKEMDGASTNTPSYQKTKQAADAPDNLDVPTYQHKQKIQQIVKEEEDNLNGYLNSNPDLTPQQIETARISATERVKKLVTDLQASRAATVRAVDDAEVKVADDVAAQQKVVDEVQAAKEEAEAPVNPVADPAKSAETTANDAYNDPLYTLDQANADTDLLTDRIKDVQGKTNNPLLKMFNAVRRQTSDRYRGAVDTVRDKANDLYYDKGISSGNAITAGIARAPRIFFDKFGMKDADRMVSNTFESVKSANASRIKAHANDLDDMFAQTDDVAESSKRLYQFFEEPDMLARMYGEGTQKIDFNMLTPQEQAIASKLMELNKVRNEIWYRILQERFKAGLMKADDFMSARQSYIANKSGMHSPRIYDRDLADLGIEVKGSRNSNAGAFKGRKDVAELSQDTIDSINANPAQSMLFRLQTGLDELGRIETITQLKKSGYIVDTPPNKNFVRLDGQQYGTANGMYLDKQIAGQIEGRQIFNSDAGQKANDLLDVYRNSILGKADRAVKKSKTVYSPGTFMGNLFSNPLMFNRGSGVNAVSQSVNMARNVPTLADHMSGKVLDQDILDMQRMGVKIGYTADELTGSPQDFKVIGDNGAMQSVKDVVAIPNKVYGGVDDVAKVSIYKTLRSRGMDAQTAALRANQFTQDYGNAGRAVQMLADSPVLGSPFARFVPELLRLTKNNIVYNPVGVFAGLYGVAALQKELHKMSGETPEEKELRENAPGKVKIPFTAWVNQMVGEKGDISLDFPWKDEFSVNVARALGFNFPIEPGSNATESLIKNLAPFTIPFTKGANGETQFQPQQLVTSMLLAPLAQQFANKDFMGRTIDDPTDKTRWEMSSGNETKYSDQLDDKTKLNNRLYHLFMNYSPMSSETDAVATEKGVRDQLTKPGVLDEGKDYYGKDRTPEQALWRAIGIKVESNDAEARKDRVDTNQYYTEDLPATQKFLNDNPDVAEIYWKLKSTSKDRYTLVKANDIITPERWQLIQSDKSGKLLQFLGEQENRLREKSIQDRLVDPNKPIKPVDPLFTLNPEQQRTVINIMSRPTGDDKEAEQILRATQPWFTQFEDARRDYYKQNEAYYNAQDIESQSKPNPRVKEYYDIEYPTTPPLVEQYYKIKNEQGDDAAKAFSSAQGDALSEQFDADSKARWIYTNKKREIEGYPPISAEVWQNDTFGFKKDTGSGSGWGGGWGSGGGGSEKTVNNLGELTNFSNDISRLTKEEAAAMPDLARLFAALQAGQGGGKAKPKIGASSRGQ